MINFQFIFQSPFFYFKSQSTHYQYSSFNNFILHMRRSSDLITSQQHVQQWAIINQQRALQARKMIELKKQIEYNKKQQFKNDLDSQIMSRHGKQDQQQKNDREYLQYILRKAQEQKQKQQQYKRQKFLKRKQIQQQNLQTLNLLRNERPKQTSPEYQLQIGVKSQLEQKQRERKGIKQMLDTLDLQIRQKHKEGQRSRSSQFNQQINTSFVTLSSPNPAKSSKYKQDQKIYESYDKLLKERKKQEEQFYKRITQEANKKIQLQNQHRQKVEKQRKQALTAEMMQTLDNQVKDQTQKRNQQKHSNPEQSSFRFISDMWRDKPASYNKHVYSEQLRKQAEQQRERKKLSKYMSEEQYKLNMNQLNKIVYGQYSYDKYVDRSLDNIGATQIRQPALKVYGENSQFIKGELEKLKSRQRAGFYSRMQQSRW